MCTPVRREVGKPTGAHRQGRRPPALRSHRQGAPEARADESRRSRAAGTVRCRSRLSIAPHRARRERWAELDLGDHLEAVALVEGNVAAVARLEVRAETLTVTAVEHVADQLRTEAAALLRPPGAEHEEIEVRLVVGMVLVDLQ